MAKDDLEEMAASLRDASSGSHAKTILITGANSGIGLHAAKLLALTDPRHRIILIARNRDKADIAKEKVASVLINSDGKNLIPMVCDHSSLKSVNAFASQLRQLLRPEGCTSEHSALDVLCLNAATMHHSNTPEYTDDGLEKTFQTNHLAPFLLVNLIYDLVRSNGRIVVTGSGLHYSQSFGDFCGMVNPKTHTARKSFATVDGSDFQYKAAYAQSKLCNVAFTLALNRRLRRRCDIVANCFTPGLIPQSGLFRDQCAVQFAVFSSVMKSNKMSSSIEWGGGALAWMAVADKSGMRGGEYWKSPTGASLTNCSYGKEFCPVSPSEEALSEANQERLWELSSQLAGIPANIL